MLHISFSFLFLFSFILHPPRRRQAPRMVLSMLIPCTEAPGGQWAVWPNGRYAYMDDLQALSGKRPLTQVRVSTIHTPLHVGRWADHLRSHPDREFTAYLLQGLAEGFRVGFSYGSVPLRPSKNNMVSAREHPEVVMKYLHEECEKGRVIGAGGD